MAAPGFSRRAFLRAAAAAALAARAAGAVAAPSPRRPVLGAIRWDAWQAPGTPTARAVERSLSPAPWRHRLPFFAEVSPDGTVAVDGGRQEVMDREIELAAEAGLGFWAFVAYPRESPMSAGLRLYLASARRRGLRFCMASELVQWGRAAQPSAELLRWHAELLAHPDHMRTPAGRPLYFLGFMTERLIAERWGGTDGLRDAVSSFRALARGAGAADPYLVVMARPDPGAGFVRAIGADALGAYTIADGRAAEAPYSALAELAERRWEEMADSGVEVVPTAMAGWDRRPRVENPVPWEAWQRPGAGMDRFYHPGSAEEVAAHLRRCVDWVAARPATVPAGAALVYAWNENDEGGWLVPTLPFDDSRLKALRRALSR
ncbi:MAG: hypothetical protein ICV73_08040 [Acetobacteraceae bacterium]|nr:hypothetical protein [Acetobacteraceae bacterium]